ncbi:hypothetical protein HanIR_Chr13g0650311 [Helianthus annuus]|nr:hypothetical protein HanIR_Chr13g0650311 [Helianthus annuus]
MGHNRRYLTDVTTYLRHINLGNLYMTLMVTRYAPFAFGSAYVTSLHILAETGQTISFFSQNPECVYVTHIKQACKLVGSKPHSKPVFA